MKRQKTKIIAEVSSNHGGNLAIAKEFIRVAASVGIDYIKFQSWQARKMKENDAQYEWFKQSELSDEAHRGLMEECKKHQIGFLTTCFDVERVDFLAALGLETIKIGSADTTSFLMLQKLSIQFKHLIVSTGMATDSEISKTARLLKGKDFSFLHCVSLYPTPLEEVNLSRMDWLKQFTPSVGYSDHCVGIDAVKLAIACQAAYIEKHFTLGEGKCPRTMPWDGDPGAFEEIVKYRDFCDVLLGDGEAHFNEKIMETRKRFIGRFGNNQ